MSAFDTMRRGFMISFATAAPAVSAAFLASLVEVVEAFTIVLATGTLRGWRAAIAGTAAALAVLVVIVVALGPLLDRVPVHWLKLIIGTLLLLFGMGWLRKRVAPLSTGSVVSLRSRRCCSRASRSCSS